MESKKARYRVKFIRNHPFLRFKYTSNIYIHRYNFWNLLFVCVLVKILKKGRKGGKRKGGKKERERGKWKPRGRRHAWGASNKSSSLERKLECNDTYNLLPSPFCGHYTYSCSPRIRRIRSRISERERNEGIRNRKRERRAPRTGM